MMVILFRGLYRVHQFSKAEMFILCRPEESDFYHEELIRIEEDLFSSLGLHYKLALWNQQLLTGHMVIIRSCMLVFFLFSGRTLDMASGDLGAPAYRKFDIEAWMPGLERFGEVLQVSLSLYLYLYLSLWKQ